MQSIRSILEAENMVVHSQGLAHNVQALYYHLRCSGAPGCVFQRVGEILLAFMGAD